MFTSKGKVAPGAQDAARSMRRDPAQTVPVPLARGWFMVRKHGFLMGRQVFSGAVKIWHGLCLKGFEGDCEPHRPLKENGAGTWQ